MASLCFCVHIFERTTVILIVFFYSNSTISHSFIGKFHHKLFICSRTCACACACVSLPVRYYVCLRRLMNRYPSICTRRQHRELCHHRFVAGIERLQSGTEYCGCVWVCWKRSEETIIKPTDKSIKQQQRRRQWQLVYPGNAKLISNKLFFIICFQVRNTLRSHQASEGRELEKRATARRRGGDNFHYLSRSR